MGLLILLSILGTAFGFRAIDPQQSGAFDGVGMGAGIWWIITRIITLSVGGYVTGHLSGIPEKRSATAHGATVWGLVTLTMLWLATSTVGAAINTVTGAVTGAARAAASAANTGATDVLRPSGVSQHAKEEAQAAAKTMRDKVEQVDPAQLEQDVAQTAEKKLDALSSTSWSAFFALSCP